MRKQTRPGHPIYNLRIERRRTGAAGDEARLPTGWPVGRLCLSAPTVRARIFDGLEFLGIELEEKRNAANEGEISAAASRAAVRVMHTDEEVMIARSVCQVLGLPMGEGK